MAKYLSMLAYEFKNIVRDRMTLVLLVYPILIILFGAFVIPLLIDNYASGDGKLTATLVVIIVFASLAPLITGAMLGFNLLDHKDENSLNTIRVTPLSLRGYILFKSVYAYCLSFIASFFSVFGVKHLSGDGYTVGPVNLWDMFNWGDIFVYALVASLFTPLFALFLAAVAKNKIEGFAYMKSSGIFMLLPVLVIIDTMQNWKQYILGIFPIFWPVKGLLVDIDMLDHAHNLPGIWYHIIGVLYMATLIVSSYKYFEKKTQI
ncbi:MAG: ABC transporter permease [Candidatus Izemoplasmataceae bacterium]